MSGVDYGIRSNQLFMLRGGNLVTLDPTRPNTVKGDIVTDGEHWFMALNDTAVLPEQSSPDWILLDSRFWAEDTGADYSSYTPVNALANFDAAIVPKGAGALRARTDGNSRGVRAVDLQQSGAAINVASGTQSVIAGGGNNTASGLDCVVVGGNSNVANAPYTSIVGGQGNLASGLESFIGGGINNTVSAVGNVVTGGSGNAASGLYSTIDGGINNIAGGDFSFAAGESTQAFAGHGAAFGSFNDGTPFGGATARIFSIGNGVSAVARSNTFSVTLDGNTRTAGAFIGGGADFAEWLESSLDAKIPRGTSVVMEKGLIRPAAEGETPIGVISTAPALVGNEKDTEWHSKYAVDADGKRIIEEYTYEVEVPVTETVAKTVIELVKFEQEDGTVVYKQTEVVKNVEEQVMEEFDVLDGAGNKVDTITKPVMKTVTRTGERLKMNDAYDADSKYIARSARPEWNLVGLVGQVPVLKGQELGANWKLMKEIDDEFDLMLIM